MYNMYDNIIIDDLILKFDLNKKIIFNDKQEVNDEEIKK